MLDIQFEIRTQFLPNASQELVLVWLWDFGEARGRCRTAEETAWGLPFSFFLSFFLFVRLCVVKCDQATKTRRMTLTGNVAHMEEVRKLHNISVCNSRMKIRGCWRRWKANAERRYVGGQLTKSWLHSRFSRLGAVAKHCELRHEISPSLKAIPFMKQFRADWRQGMLAIILCRTICLPDCYPEV